MKTDITFPDSLSPVSFVVIPIVLGEGYGPTAGTIKHLKVKPGTRVPSLLDTKWEKNKDGRPQKLRKVELLESQVEAGCFLLQEQYEAEGFVDGWKAYEKWMMGCYPRKGAGGKQVAPSRGKAFPERALPKRVLELRGAASAKKAEAAIPAGLVHPADRDRATEPTSSVPIDAPKRTATTKPAATADAK